MEGWDRRFLITALMPLARSRSRPFAGWSRWLEMKRQVAQGHDLRPCRQRARRYVPSLSICGLSLYKRRESVQSGWEEERSKCRS